jgi:type II secretory pathway pseudopilin PulG
MRGLVVIAGVIVLALLVWSLVRSVRRGRAVRRQSARWVVETWTKGAATAVGVRRRRSPDVIADQVVVAEIDDSDPEWLTKRAQAYEEAVQRATELNASTAGDRP